MEYKEYLQTLSKNEKRFLAKFECALCGQSLNFYECSAMWHSCTDEKRIKRAKKCLANYKPKQSKRIALSF